MGQRLVITVHAFDEDIATIYYHWSAYTTSALDEAQKILKNVKWEDTTSKDELFLSRQVVYSFGGFADKLFKKAVTLGEWCNQHPEDQITKKRMNKTIMNMIRLYLMVFDILEKGEIITNRAENHDLLMMARNGEFQAANGYIKHDVKDFHKEYEKRLQYDKANTALPGTIDRNRVNELVMTINRMALEMA